MVIYQTARAQPSGDAEEKVESAHQPAVPAKLRDQPSRLRSGRRGQACDQRFQSRLIEAIEKEVRDDQVVLSRRQRGGARVFATIIDVLCSGTCTSQSRNQWLGTSKPTISAARALRLSAK